MLIQSTVAGPSAKESSEAPWTAWPTTNVTKTPIQIRRHAKSVVFIMGDNQEPSTKNQAPRTRHQEPGTKHIPKGYFYKSKKQVLPPDFTIDKPHGTQPERA